MVQCFHGHTTTAAENAGNEVVVYVVHTQRRAATRIISARKATRNEREQFHAYLRKALG